MEHVQTSHQSNCSGQMMFQKTPVYSKPLIFQVKTTVSSMEGWLAWLRSHSSLRCVSNHMKAESVLTVYDRAETRSPDFESSTLSTMLHSKTWSSEAIRQQIPRANKSSTRNHREMRTSTLKKETRRFKKPVCHALRVQNHKENQQRSIWSYEKI